MQENKLLAGLNEAQKEAVLTQNGPLLIVAGAGSGKTKVLTHRIAHLIYQGVLPDKILAVTFTNKAAGEMRERVSRLLNAKPCALNADNTPWIGTFHSLGAWILRREAKIAGLAKNFVIFDEEDGLAIMKESIKELELDPKQFQPSRIKKTISRKKGGLETADDFASEAKDLFSKTLAQIWQTYDQKLKTNEGLDFDDLLVKTYFLFSDSPQTLAKYQERWQYVNIDEYQDTDQVQYRLANMLAQKHKNICVVGDIDQSIYSFRGADFRNILNFENDWPEAKIITLEENYRSHAPILNAANAVISKNFLRKPKTLFTQKTGGDKIGIFAAESENDEAEFIAQKTEEFIKNRVSPDEIAVLMRTNAQSRVLEEKFLERKIPYFVVGVKFYLRKEIKDALAYMRAALNPKDSLSLKRIINTPPRGIGKVTMAKYLSGLALGAGEKERISAFEKTLSGIKKSLLELPTSKAVALTLKESGYMEFLNEGTEEDAMRLANLKEMVSLAKKFDELPPEEGALKLLEEASLMSEQDTMAGKKIGVPITTVHAAKGLEFDHVFVAGLEDGLFPHSSIGGEDEKLRLEEERRLFYVALTRARKKVFLTLAFFRTIFGEKQANMPSRFLEDIPPELLEHAKKENVIRLN